MYIYICIYIYIYTYIYIPAVPLLGGIADYIMCVLMVTIQLQTLAVLLATQ